MLTNQSPYNHKHHVTLSSKLKSWHMMKCNQIFLLKLVPECVSPVFLVLAELVCKCVSHQSKPLTHTWLAVSAYLCIVTCVLYFIKAH